MYRFQEQDSLQTLREGLDEFYSINSKFKFYKTSKFKLYKIQNSITKKIKIKLPISVYTSEPISI